MNESDIPGYVKEAFKDGKFEIITIPAGTGLYKLSQYPIVNESRGNSVSPWWSPVRPFREDKLGAVGRYQEAELNGVSFEAMVRFASAVRVDWNGLDNYQEISLTKDVEAVWGQFQPQPAYSPAEKGKKVEQMIKNIEAKIKIQEKGHYVPEILGGIEAYQFWIPNLTKSDLRTSSTIPTNDKKGLAVALGLA